jgi:hypothetical protein
VSADGVFSVHVPRDSIISCTTTTGQQKGVAPVWPPPRFPNLAFFLFFVLSLSWQMIVFHIGLAKLWTRSNTSKFHRLSLQSSLTAHYKQFPFPYTATFDQETVHKPARFFADNDGSFEVLPSLTQVRTRFYLAIHSCKTKVIHLPRHAWDEHFPYEYRIRKAQHNRVELWIAYAGAIWQERSRPDRTVLSYVGLRRHRPDLFAWSSRLVKLSRCGDGAGCVAAS